MPQPLPDVSFELVPKELCNRLLEFDGTPAAFKGGFKTERIVDTLERLRQLLAS